MKTHFVWIILLESFQVSCQEFWFRLELVEEITEKHSKYLKQKTIYVNIILSREIEYSMTFLWVINEVKNKEKTKGISKNSDIFRI